MTNPHRGEFVVDLGGERRVLRLTLQALAEIEATFGMNGLQQLGRRLGAGIGAADIAAIAGAMLRAGGARVSNEEAGALINARDLPILIEAIGTLFQDAFAEGDKPDPRGPQDIPIR